MKRKLVLSLLLFAVCAMAAQTVWHNPLNAGVDVVQNRLFGADGTFDRIPAEKRLALRPPLQSACRQSAGLALQFYSNAKEITIRYSTTAENRAMVHMPATGVAGIDLYARNSDGLWNRLAGSYSLGKMAEYRFSEIKNLSNHALGHEYRLFLPLYNGVETLEIGVEEGSEFKWIPASKESGIVVYGTSIVQGACASRPGKSWTNILQLSLDLPVVNLGFSGNGLLESEIIQLMSQTPAALYVLDCVPNLVEQKDSAEIIRLTVNAVRQLRQASQTPILIVEHSGMDGASVHTLRQPLIDKANAATRAAYEQLVGENTPHLYYITREELAIDDMRVDYVHLSDQGMVRMAEAIEKRAREILHMPKGAIITQQPVTQRREPATYEWMERHQAICQYVREEKPRGVVFGNSITHYWGGKPSHPRLRRGKDVWDQTLAPLGFANLGCGWDRVENVLWRVEHGELDGYSPQYVVLLIGTNNFGLNTPEETAEGLRTIVKAVKLRQPETQIILSALLPRKGGEEWIEAVNVLLHKISVEENCRWINPGEEMLKDGKTNLELFSDGLHPNAAGYEILARSILKAL